MLIKKIYSYGVLIGYGLDGKDIWFGWRQNAWENGERLIVENNITLPSNAWIQPVDADGEPLKIRRIAEQLHAGYLHI